MTSSSPRRRLPGTTGDLLSHEVHRLHKRRSKPWSNLHKDLYLLLPLFFFLFTGNSHESLDNSSRTTTSTTRKPEPHPLLSPMCRCLCLLSLLCLCQCFLPLLLCEYCLLEGTPCARWSVGISKKLARGRVTALNDPLSSSHIILSDWDAGSARFGERSLLLLTRDRHQQPLVFFGGRLPWVSFWCRIGCLPVHVRARIHCTRLSGPLEFRSGYLFRSGNTQG